MSRVPINKTLYPRGGSRFKNSLAKRMVAMGQKRVNAEADREKINRRVPPAPELEGPHYNDSFVFQGSAPNGDFFMSRLGFRSEGRAEPWVYFEIDGRLYYNNEIHLVREADDGKTISAGGLTYTYLSEKNKWQITFDGTLYFNKDNSGKEEKAKAKVKLDLIYHPLSEMYLSSIHMDAESTGRAMAEMSWNRDYFQALRSESATRIEQGAELTGTVEIDGKSRQLKLLGFRDHSWGKRDWAFIKRYIWNIFALNNPILIEGKPYEYICFTTVDYGTSFKHLVSGWFAGTEDIRPIVASSNMNELAADGSIPDNYTVIFQPAGSIPLTVSVHRSPHNHSWMMNNGDFEVNEAYCRLEVKGEDHQTAEGQGMSEFGFARDSGIERPCFKAENK